MPPQAIGISGRSTRNRKRPERRLRDRRRREAEQDGSGEHGDQDSEEGSHLPPTKARDDPSRSGRSSSWDTLPSRERLLAWKYSITRAFLCWIVLALCLGLEALAVHREGFALVTGITRPQKAR